MKFKFLKASTLAAGILLSGKLFAQSADTIQATNNYVKPFSGSSAFRTWSFGVNAGILTTNTVFTSNDRLGFTSPKGEFGYGGYIKNQILPSFGIQLDFLRGSLAGNSPQLPGSNTFNAFSTSLNYAFSLSGNFTLANINWHYKEFGIQPYITAGVGTMAYKPVLTLNNGNIQNFKVGDDGVINELYTPVGLGLKFNIARGINLDLGYQVNFVYSNNLDGYHYGFGNEKFAYAHAGLEFALGSKSKPQLSTHNPVASMRHEYMWENEQTKAKLQAQIDAENAQIAAEKAKNDQLRADLNNTNANLAKLTMDTDGDGVPDFFDKCPNTPAGAKVDGSGCPLPVAKQSITKVYITAEDKKVVSQAVRDLEFEFNKSTIKEHSFPSLDRLAQLLKDKGFNLKLSGYTDNVGGQAFNLKLSKERAGAVKTYLLNKGVDDKLIKAEGYGKTHPIASNKTAHGRQLNRRVEFSIYQD